MLQPRTPLRTALASGLALLLVGGCSESVLEPEGTAPSTTVRSMQPGWEIHTSEVTLADAKIVAAARAARGPAKVHGLTDPDLEAGIAALFPGPGLVRAAQAQVRNILRDLERGNDQDALLKARDFRGFALQRYERGQLLDPNGGGAPTTEEALASLLNGIFEAVGVPGGQTVGLSRITYGSPLIDGVEPGAFPRGGSYTATITGDGLERATGIVFDHPEVFGFPIGSPGPGLLTVRLRSAAVARGRPDLAEILDVPFQVTEDLGGGAPLSIGSGTLDIVPGPAPVTGEIEIFGPNTVLPRGRRTSIDFALDIASAGNIRFYFVGCALCRVDFNGVTGGIFEERLRVTVTWDVPADYPFPDFGVGMGAVSGAELEGRAGLSIPVVDP